MEKRQLRGLEIAKQKQVRKSEEGWLVKSQSSEGFYRVSEDFNCTCPDCQGRKVTCKHAYAVRYYLQAENEQGKVIHKQRLTYKQAWNAYTSAQTQEIRLFDELLKDLVAGFKEGEGQQGRGRPKTPLNEALFCSIQKVYSQLSSRRAASLYFNASEKHQIRKPPNYNVINVFLNKPEITPILQELIAITASPLKAVETDFAVDSTGFRTKCFGQYAEEKYDLKREHKWLKAHACVGVKTNVVTSIEVLPEHSADVSQLPVLVERTANGGFTVKEVSADKAYSSRANLEAVASVGGVAYIPFKSSATGQARGSLLWKKAYHFFKLNQDEFYEHYHKRLNVETTFGAIKKKFGDTLKAKNHTAQVNELLCKVIAYNITVLIQEMHELGIKPDFVEAKVF